MKQLLVDAGNTRVKWALVDSEAPQAPWLAQGAVLHAELAGVAPQWAAFAPRFVLISNVAGAALAERLAALLPAGVTIEWFISQPALAGLRNRYREPGKLGCDRFASAIAAHALYPQRALLVATCGTATTLDAITADGDFIGGMILPGLGLMASSLARNTAQLPHIALGLDPAQPFANTTDAAIASGCLCAQAGAIERAVALHARAAPVTLLLSGGAATLVAPHLAIPFEAVDNLVLLGLHRALTLR